MDPQPIPPVPAGLGIAFGTTKRNRLGPARTLLCPDTHAVDDPPLKLGVGNKISPNFTFNGAAFQITRALTVGRARPHLPLVDHVEESLGRLGQQKRKAGSRLPDMIENSVPVHIRNRGMHDQKLTVRHNAPEHDRHRLRVLAARMIDGKKGSPIDEIADFLRNRKIGSGMGHRHAALESSTPGNCLTRETNWFWDMRLIPEGTSDLRRQGA